MVRREASLHSYFSSKWRFDWTFSLKTPLGYHSCKLGRPGHTTSALSMSNINNQHQATIKADLGGGGGLRGSTAVPRPLPAPSPPLMPSGAQGVSASTGGDAHRGGGLPGTYGYNTCRCRTSIWPCQIIQGQDLIDLGIFQIAELFTLRCDQTLSVSVSPKSYHNIRWITAVQGHVRNFFIFWLGSFLCGKGLEDKHCDADLVRVNEYFWVFLPVFSCLFFRQAL